MWLALLLIRLCTGAECPNQSVYSVPITDPTKPAVWSRQFEGCPLTEVTLIEGFTEIATYGFYQCRQLVTVHLPTTLKIIDSSAFFGCSQLASINLPEGLEELGFSAIRGTALTSVVLPSTLKKYVNLVFAENTRLTSISFRSPCEDFQTFNNEYLLNGNGTVLLEVVNGCQNIVIPSGVETFGGHCLAYCQPTLQPNGKLIIPDHVKHIQGRFCYATNYIRTIYIGEGVVSISGESFDNAYDLTRVEVNPKNEKYESDSNGILYEKGCTTLMAYAQGKNDTIVSLPDRTKIVSVAAFTSNRNLRAFTVSQNHPYFQVIDDVVYTKPDSAGKIEAVICPPGKTGPLVLPNNVSIIRGGAFYFNYLSTVTLPEGLKEIGYMAFRTASMTSYNIPSTVTWIENKAFYDCKFFPTLEIPSSVTELSEYTWHHCIEMTSVKMHGRYKVIPLGIFSLCSKIVNIEFPDTVEIIEKSAFSGCSKLRFFPFPQHTLKEIRESAFEDCVSLNTTVIIPHCVKFIDMYAFARCGSIDIAIVMNCATFVHRMCFHMVDNLQYTCIATIWFTPVFSGAPGIPLFVQLFGQLIGEALI